MRSKLDAIHLLALFEYPLMEEYGINDILSPFCDDLKELSKVKGITVLILCILMCSSNSTNLLQGCNFNIHGKEMWFQGALLAFIGDTPANNRIGGYKESVSKAYRLCRQCLATHEVIQLTVK